MSSSHSASKELPIKEILEWVKLKRKKALLLGFLGVLLGLLNVICRAPDYMIEAAYLLQKPSSLGIEGELAKKISKEKKSEALSLEPFFHSEKIQKEAILKSGLQVSLDEQSTFSKILKNVTLHFLNFQKVVHLSPFEFEVKNFEGIVPLHCKIQARSTDSFDVIDAHRKKTYRVGEIVELKSAQFVVTKIHSKDPIVHKLTLHPMEEAYEKVKRKLTISAHKKLSNLTQFVLKYPSHQVGKKFLNALIEVSEKKFSEYQKGLLSQEALLLEEKKEVLKSESLSPFSLTRPLEWAYQTKIRHEEQLKEEIEKESYLIERLSQLITNHAIEPVIELKIDVTSIKKLADQMASINPVATHYQLQPCSHLDKEAIKEEIKHLSPILEEKKKELKNIDYLVANQERLSVYELEEHPILKAAFIEREGLKKIDKRALSTSEQGEIESKVQKLSDEISSMISKIVKKHHEQVELLESKESLLLVELKAKLQAELDAEKAGYFTRLQEEYTRLSGKRARLQKELADVQNELLLYKSRLEEAEVIEKINAEKERKLSSIEEMLLMKQIEKDSPYKAGVNISGPTSSTFPKVRLAFVLVPIQGIIVSLFSLFIELARSLALGWLPSPYQVKRLGMKAFQFTHFSKEGGKKLFITETEKRARKGDLTLSTGFKGKLLKIDDAAYKQIAKSCVIFIHPEDLDKIDYKAFSKVGVDINTVSKEVIQMIFQKNNTTMGIY